MTDPKPTGKKTDVFLWWALGIALAAFGLRLSLINFQTHSHPDEPIVAALMERSVNQGILTANWAGFDQPWSRPTYQFSPYTLVQSATARLVYWLISMPTSPDGYILLARLSSCVWGALAVLLVFFLGRACFSPPAALWGEAILATCFLQVQDSIYARVDSFLCLLVLVSLFLAVRAAKRPGCYSWLVATSLSVGVTIAAKYNAIPVLVLIPFIPFRWAQAGAISRGRAVLLVFASLFIAGIGFVGATPELLWQAGPLITGLQYELNHYQTGHIPYQAYDWGDNNLFYWTRYLAWLGFGLLPSLFALLFVVRIAVLRRWEDFMLGTFLTVAAVLILATKVRFERNLEICLGPLALVAGVTAWDLFRWMKGRPNVVVARFLGIAFVSLWFCQPLRVLYHFRETLDYPRQLKAQLRPPLLMPVHTAFIRLKNEPPESAVMGYDQVLLEDFGDPFSAEIVARWRRILGRDHCIILTSPWSRHGYPFSTVDVYHGPSRVYVFQRSAKPANIAPLAPQTAPAGGKQAKRVQPGN
jgi:4-amino-4-deoxy-L-arabinose transferase-like glycosyltransferase